MTTPAFKGPGQNRVSDGKKAEGNPRSIQRASAVKESLPEEYPPREMIYVRGKKNIKIKSNGNAKE
ncbi:MAG TPA: hypothetical protein VIR29_04060 [Anseongella sp.]